MKNRELLFHRMRSQGIAPAGFGNAEGVVGWMGCLQAQDFAAAKWAVGMRMGGGEPGAVTEAVVDAAFNEGRILRTHVLRPTWHFVLPADIGWMLRLTGSRVKTFCQPYHRQLGIDAAVLRRSKKIMVKAMEGGVSLMRQELAVLFRQAKIDTSDIRMNYLLMDAELDGLICSGPRKGKQFTYALLEERAPRQGSLRQDEYREDAALAELARRYFASRGPATVADLAWWGGMTLGQARRGLAIVGQELECVVIGDVEYWFGGGRMEAGVLGQMGVPVRERKGAGRTVQERAGVLGQTGAGRPGHAAAGKEVVLLPAFDEYTVAYKDRDAIVPAEYAKASFYGLKPVVLVRGRVAGMWKRTLDKGKVRVEVEAFGAWGQTVKRLVKKEAERFAAFAGDGKASVVIS